MHMDLTTQSREHHFDLDQSGFTKGRQTSNATRRLINNVYLARKKKKSSLLLALDVEKAFDRVHWQCLTIVLERFSFKGHMLSVILALYTSLWARVYTSGMVSKPLEITNGTRQECPISPLIFNLLIKPLAASIRQNHDIQGFQIKGRKHVIILSMDDVVLMLTNPVTSLEHISSLLK